MVGDQRRANFYVLIGGLTVGIIFLSFASKEGLIQIPPRTQYLPTILVYPVESSAKPAKVENPTTNATSADTMSQQDRGERSQVALIDSSVALDSDMKGPSGSRRDRVKDAFTAGSKVSQFSIIDPMKEYRLCDRLDVMIKIKTEDGGLSTGGDFFRVTIFNTKLHAGASSDGPPTYIGQGRYHVSFTLRWVGETFVRVVLVHSSEAIDILRRVRDSHPSRFGYYGRFQRKVGEETTTEDVKCNVVPPPLTNVTDTLCNLSNDRVYGPWFCESPKDLQCSDFSWTSGNLKYTEEIRKTINITKEETALLQKQKKMIQAARGINRVRVLTNRAGVNVTNSPICVNEGLPPCLVGCHNMSSTTAAGFFYHGTWASNYCRLRAFRAQDALRCLTNKIVYFHGDSTTRQYYTYLVEKLGETLKPNPPTRQSNWKVGPSVAEDKPHNFTIHYRHHGYPIRNNWTDASEVKYIADALDELDATPDTVFMFTIWAHLTTVNMSFYEERVQRIRAAVERLHKRSPATLIILKSANTRVGSPITMSDWYAWELDMKMREIFKNYDNIGFIDQWTMALGFSHTDNVHPAPGVIESGIKTLLSYMCPEEDYNVTTN